MNITHENNQLVLRLDLFQDSYDALGEKLPYRVSNLIGIIAGNQYSISNLIDLGYKDDQQEGEPIIVFPNKEDLLKVCEDFRLDVIEHPTCAYCEKPIYGSYTFGDKGNKCFDCELKEEIKS